MVQYNQYTERSLHSFVVFPLLHCLNYLNLRYVDFWQITKDKNNNAKIPREKKNFDTSN